MSKYNKLEEYVSLHTLYTIYLCYLYSIDIIVRYIA